MTRKRSYWNVVTVVCSVLMFFIGIVPKVSAIEVTSAKAFPLTQNELPVLAAQDKASTDLYSTPSGTGNDGLAVLGAIGLVILLLALLANAADDDEE